MEIESKYIVPDSETFQRLQTLTTLGDYTVKEPVTKTITDTYLDTATGLIRQGGFACRLRHNLTQDTWLATVKGLGGVSDGIHRREEFEIEIPAEVLPAHWPSSQARDLVLNLAQAQPFIKLFLIKQVRQVRLICLRDLVVAEWSLDEVAFVRQDQQVQMLELEIELKNQGTLADLRALDELLIGYNLRPEPRSKFEYGLSLRGDVYSQR